MIVPDTAPLSRSGRYASEQLDVLGERPRGLDRHADRRDPGQVAVLDPRVQVVRGAGRDGAHRVGELERDRDRPRVADRDGRDDVALLRAALALDQEDDRARLGRELVSLLVGQRPPDDPGVGRTATGDGDGGWPTATGVGDGVADGDGVGDGDGGRASRWARPLARRVGAGGRLGGRLGRGLGRRLGRRLRRRLGGRLGRRLGRRLGASARPSARPSARRSARPSAPPSARPWARPSAWRSARLSASGAGSGHLDHRHGDVGDDGAVDDRRDAAPRTTTRSSRPRCRPARRTSPPGSMTPGSNWMANGMEAWAGEGMASRATIVPVASLISAAYATAPAPRARTCPCA